VGASRNVRAFCTISVEYDLAWIYCSTCTGCIARDEDHDINKFVLLLESQVSFIPATFL